MKTKDTTMEQQRIQRLTTASEWLLRLENPKRTEEEVAEWLCWCDEHPDNIEAFETLRRDWHDLDALRGAPDLYLSDEQKTALLIEERTHADASQRVTLAKARAHRVTILNRTLFALAASLTAVAITFVLKPKPAVPASPPQQVSAQLINRAATLPDGSRIILGAKTEVNVDFNGAQRTLALSSGEAYFKVKHDKSRPFVVHAGEVSVTAIGTAFDIRRENDTVTVTVEEGIVEVASQALGASGNPTTWRAEAGYQLKYSSLDRTASIASIEPSKALMWRKGELAYVREPLGSVIEDLNRYSTRRIVIDDPELAKLPFTGTAFASSLDDWLAGVEQAYPISAQETATGDIVLEKK